MLKENGYFDMHCEVIAFTINQHSCWIDILGGLKVKCEKLVTGKFIVLLDFLLNNAFTRMFQIFCGGGSLLSFGLLFYCIHGCLWVATFFYTYVQELIGESCSKLNVLEVTCYLEILWVLIYK